MSSLGTPRHRRKRQRLSSPTYDEQVSLSQDEVAAFDDFERQRTQSLDGTSPLKMSQANTSYDRRKRDEAIALALGLKSVVGDDEGDQSSEERSQSPSPSLPADRKENRKPSGSDHAYSHSSSRTSPINSPPNSPRSLSKHQGLSPNKMNGFMPASSPGNPFTSKSSPTSPSRKRVSGFTSALRTEHSAMRNATPSGISNPVTKTTGFGFASALDIAYNKPAGNYPSSYPDPPPEQDLAAWFQSTDVSAEAVNFTSASALRSAEDDVGWFQRSTVPPTATGFQSAKELKIAGNTTLARGIAPSRTPSDANSPFDDKPELSLRDSIPNGSGFLGFTTGRTLLDPSAASSSTWVAPSKAALEKATEMMSRWEKEIDQECMHTAEGEENLPSIQLGQHDRMILGSMDDNFPRSTPLSPSPAGPDFGKPLAFGTPGSIGIRNSKKPFKSPLLVPPNPSSPLATRPPLANPSKSIPVVASPLNPSRTPSFKPVSSTLAAFTNSTFSTPEMPSTPLRPGTGSPQKRALGMSAKRPGTNSTPGRKPFTTPFKPGMRPGEPGRFLLEQQRATQTSGLSSQNARSPVKLVGFGGNPIDKGKSKDVCATDTDKLTLASSGLIPHSYTIDELETKGLNTAELLQINPSTALYYSFHTASPFPITSSQIPLTQVTLGSAAAYKELQESGCTLATQEWVDNHWILILWKLAGMAALEPDREHDVSRKRWCWREVMRQLRHRYNRELNGTSRPALRLITTQDAPASCPMVLCVSNIIQLSTEGGIPELEITDGWYRLRAQIDAPLARAIHKGIVRIGGKIAVTGCRLETDRKDPAEILETYDSIMLKIYGNSSSLAPWHAKLGFQKTPFVSSLRSLTSDGGLVAVIDVVVEKSYPIAFLETIEDEDGQKHSLGPWNEKEEHVAYEKWRARREVEAGKLRNDFEKDVQRWEAYAERLQRQAAPKFRPALEESPPDHIEDLIVELEDAPNANEIFKSLNPIEAGWLAQALQQKVDKDRERFFESIDQELNAVCPPRQVRNFRVIQVHDAQSFRRPAVRTAQITVWNVLELHVSEGAAAGSFSPGQRFMITNVIPSQKGAWGKDPDEASMIYLVTRKDSRFTRIR
ncbi:unnamed protein product [Somion occarium]|uniref:BRCA2 OB1 domain-containing protein n=2 Tax=Somion occarium TaxID=3059160 RepID=A0ABP1CFN1_9APHY